MPRLGFAYRIRQSTVIRGGAGLYYTLPNTDQLNGFSSVAPFAPVFSLTNTSFSDPYGTLGIANPFPASFGGKSVPGADATFTLPVRITGTFPTRYNLPTLGTWNLRVEQQIGSNVLLSVGYVGNRGYHLSSNAIGRRPLNPAIYIPGQSTEANTQARRIDPHFSGVNLYPTDLNSRYESLQFNVEKRLSKVLLRPSQLHLVKSSGRRRSCCQSVRHPQFRLGLFHHRPAQCLSSFRELGSTECSNQRMGLQVHQWVGDHWHQLLAERLPFHRI